MSAPRRSGVSPVSPLLTGVPLKSTVGHVGISVLGPLAVDGETGRLGPRDRVVLAALAMRPGEPVGRELLALDEPERAAFVLGEALDLWRGPPLSDIEAWEDGRVWRPPAWTGG